MGKQFVSQDYSRNKKGRNLKEGTRGSRAGGIFSGVFFGFSILASMAMVGMAIVFFFSDVEGPSMMSTINAQFYTQGDTDSVLVNRFGAPSRGDMIVTRFHRPDGQNVAEDGRRFTLYIKRVIGLEGEHIFFQRRELDTPVPITNEQGNPTGRFHHYFYEIQINGDPLDESGYLDSYWGRNLVYSLIYDQLHGREIGTIPARFVQRVELRNRNEIFIPPGYIFYIGDNRGGSRASPISHDSTIFGPQPMDYIIGVVASIAYDMTFFEFIWDRIFHVISFRWIWGQG